MKVGLCAWLYRLNPGGVEKLIHKEAESLIALGHTPIIFCASNLATSLKKKFNNLENVLIVETNIYLNPYVFKAKFKHYIEKYYISKTAKIISKYSCDVFHGIGLSVLPGARAGNKTVTTIIGLRGWSIEKEMLNKSDHIVVLAEKIKKQLINRGIPEKKISTIYQGVDAGAFNYELSSKDRNVFLRKHKLSPDKMYIAAIHNFAEKKRTIDLIEAFSDLLVNNKDYELLLAGIGDTQKIKARIKKLKISKYVHFLDVFGDERELSKIYKISDFFVLPGSTYPEDTQIPLVLYEAMCSGIPIISANVGAVSEIFNKDVGVLVKPSCKKSLLEALEIFTGSDIPNYNKQTIIEHGDKFDWKVSTKKLIEIYSSI